MAKAKIKIKNKQTKNHKTKQPNRNKKWATLENISQKYIYPTRQVFPPV